MWSLAFGVVVLAIVASVVLYASLHTPAVITVDLAHQLYAAKRALDAAVPRLPVVENFAEFKSRANVLWGRQMEIDGENAAYLKVPLGARLSYRAPNVLYELEAFVESCIPGALPSGEPVVVYVVKMRHSMDPVPWIETYAAFSRGEPPNALLSRDHVVKVERVLAYNATSGYTTLYVAAPSRAVGIYVVDHPLWLPLTCP